MPKRSGYRLINYGDMITDRPRMEPYVQALRQAVRPGCIVLDLGAGTGIFSLLACQFGAGQVYAIEPNEAIHVARAMATDNGCASKITFYQAFSTAVRLPELVDVIIFDLRSVLPIWRHDLRAIIDARLRFLTTDGIMIPVQDTLWVSLIDDQKLYQPYAEPWTHNEYGLDLRAGQPLVVNTQRKARAKAEQLLVPPHCWATLDYGTIENPNVEGESMWTAERAGTAHGLIVWFDAELAEGTRFSNAPGQPEVIYGQAFFPLQEPVEIQAGDSISVHLRADLVDDDYTWQWHTRISAQGSRQTKTEFKQSTFFGGSLSPASLRKREMGYRPVLDETGRVESFILSMMTGHNTLEEIAQRAFQEFPSHFAGWKEALALAADLATRYS